MKQRVFHNFIFSFYKNLNIEKKKEIQSRKRELEKNVKIIFIGSMGVLKRGRGPNFDKHKLLVLMKTNLKHKNIYMKKKKIVVYFYLFCCKGEGG